MLQEGETFTERLQRLRELETQPAAAPAATACGTSETSSSRKRRRKQRAAAAAKQTFPGKRPGKRQRQAMKDEVFGLRHVAQHDKKSGAANAHPKAGRAKNPDSKQLLKSSKRTGK